MSKINECMECGATESPRFRSLAGNKWQEAEAYDLIKVSWEKNSKLCHSCYMNLVENQLRRLKREAKWSKVSVEEVDVVEGDVDVVEASVNVVEEADVGVVEADVVEEADVGVGEADVVETSVNVVEANVGAVEADVIEEADVVVVEVDVVEDDDVIEVDLEDIFKDIFREEIETKIKESIELGDIESTMREDVEAVDGEEEVSMINFIGVIRSMARIFYEREHTRKEGPIYSFDEMRELLPHIDPSLKTFFDQLYSLARPLEHCEQTVGRMKRLIVFLCYLLASLNNSKINSFKFDLAYYLDSVGTSNEGLNTLANIGITTA